MVLPFWCWLTQIVLKKRLLNGCNSSRLVEAEYLMIDVMFVSKCTADTYIIALQSICSLMFMV